MSKFCKRTTMLQICKFSHSSYSKTGLKEYGLELIDHSTAPMNCNYVIFKIHDLTFVPLETENNYIVIPEKETQVDTLCGVSKTLVIKEPSVLSSDESCTLTYGNSLMKIGGSDRSANFEIKYKEFKNLNDTLNELYMISEQLPTAPKMTSNFNNYKITLKQINSQIEQIKFERRIKTLKEIGMSVLQILGYISIGAIILYILYKCKFCQIISKCIPGTLCINILSPTANPVLHQRQGP